jgi:hypothetical protein
MRASLTPGRSLPARAARRHADGPDGPVPVACATEIAAFLRDDTRQLGRTMQLELVVAQYLVRLRDAVTPAGEPLGPRPVLPLVEDIEAYGDGLSRAILATIADLADGDVAVAAADGAARLAERGLQYPARFRAVGSARALEAWTLRDGGESCLTIEFEHADRARHSVMAFVAPEGHAKHVAFAGSAWDIDPEAPFHPDRLTPTPTRLAARAMATALSGADPATGRPASESLGFWALIAQARVRSATP